MRIGVLTDIHAADPGRGRGSWHNEFDFDRSLPLLDAALDRLADERLDAIFLIGDLTADGQDQQFDAVLGRVAALGVPVWCVQGNHDCDVRITALAERVAAHAAETGDPVAMGDPAGDEYVGFRIVGLPVVAAPPSAPDYTIAPVLPASWGSDPVLLFTHPPLIDIEDPVRSAGLKFAGGFVVESDASAKLRDRDAPTVVLHGHVHIRYSVAELAAIQFGFAALVEPPHGVGVVAVARDGDEVGVAVRHIDVAPSNAPRLPVLGPAEETWRFRAREWTRVTG